MLFVDFLLKHVKLGVKGNDLLIYDTNMKSEPLKLMHTIPLKGVTDFSTRYSP